MNFFNACDHKHAETPAACQCHKSPKSKNLSKELLDVAALIDQIGPRLVARLCGVHRTTVLRWKAGQVRCPGSAVAMMRNYLEGHNPGPEWQGWRMVGGDLISPAGDRFTPGDILASPWERAALESTQKRMRLLEAQLIQATKAAALVDPASNDSAIWPGDVRAQAFT